MMLFIRMVLYAVFAALAGQGVLLFDDAAGTVTFRVEDLALLIGGAAGYVLTFIGSRIAKAKGGRT